MNLEPIVQSEVSQKEKDKYCNLMHITESRKMVLKNLLIGQQFRKRHREQTYGHGEGEERVRCMERVTWKLTLPYVKQIANREFAVWLRKLKQVLCINLEGWDGEGDGKEVQKGRDICIPMGDSC